ncbi:hypothetical protein [Alteromonas antoniana]|uniref:hypothetical protein n=1 Tax=Alteromonas antoniana TaxID=2803813 RepID=UPI001C44FE16|nr:hypothetical protein [Alteromonas antoniana]
MTNHRFTDDDIELAEANEETIVIFARETSYPALRREDVVALARHFQLTQDEITR